MDEREKQLKKTLKNFNRRMQETKDILSILEQEISFAKEFAKMRIEHPRPLKPNYAYEETVEYQDYLARYAQLECDAKVFHLTIKVHENEAILDNIKTEISKLKEQLRELKSDGSEPNNSATANCAGGPCFDN